MVIVVVDTHRVAPLSCPGAIATRLKSVRFLAFLSTSNRQHILNFDSVQCTKFSE